MEYPPVYEARQRLRDAVPNVELEPRWWGCSPFVRYIELIARTDQTHHLRVNPFTTHRHVHRRELLVHLAHHRHRPHVAFQPPARVKGSREPCQWVSSLRFQQAFSHSPSPSKSNLAKLALAESLQEEEEEEEENEDEAEEEEHNEEEGTSGCLRGLVGKVEKRRRNKREKKERKKKKGTKRRKWGRREEGTRREGGKKKERGGKSGENKTELRPSCGG